MHVIYAERLRCCVLRFRRHHEQLRQVIVRVLRPAVSAAGSAAESQVSAEPMAIELADNSSIDVCAYSARTLRLRLHRHAYKSGFWFTRECLANKTTLLCYIVNNFTTLHH